ncbi:hypothetical protein A3A70_01290 [candidate division WWE3 bacterium RIFCSPLOWO2_01_FULL_42_11]|uniref:Uncharacterized protein n=1 Tax=candidate division WWE3 bacterium RIFCSPLOWO2_01_FULL_42_11 TaxID=1802627 RepID=A0A1F4VRG8_UNCKA|nr:MAG: hypothetical protein A3A70_01290 [candidate division WWE3 bacterium RIFCSPLOWO2_01_FULL_42_11]
MYAGGDLDALASVHQFALDLRAYIAHRPAHLVKMDHWFENLRAYNRKEEENQACGCIGGSGVFLLAQRGSEEALEIVRSPLPVGPFVRRLVCRNLGIPVAESYGLFNVAEWPRDLRSAWQFARSDEARRGLVLARLDRFIEEKWGTQVA